MSKIARNVIDFNHPECHEYLEGIAFVDLLDQHKTLKNTEDKAKERRERVRSTLETALSTVKADTLTYTDPKGGHWKVVRFTPDAEYRLNEEKLTKALLEVAKLDGPMIKKVVLAAKKKIPRNPYVTVYQPKKTNGNASKGTST